MILPQHIRDMAKLSAETEALFGQIFIRKEMRKGEFLFESGKHCNQIFYIEKGLCRVYYYNQAGKEITAWFSAEESFITAIDSFYQHVPTRDYCELIEDSVVYSIMYSDVEKMLDLNIELAKFAFHAIYALAKGFTELIVNIKFQSAEDRYRLLMQQHPTILRRASLGHIASYLGITQETLSRIRSGK